MVVEPYSGPFGPPLDEVTPAHPLWWDPAWMFPRYFKVLPKEGGKQIPFQLWGSQQMLSAMSVRAMAENKRLVHVKPRKEGSSTFFTAMATAHTCFREGCQALIIAQRDDITGQLARAAVRFYNSMPEWLRPDRRDRVERSIDIPGLDSWMSLATAGQSDPARGFTGIQFLLATEISSWKSPDTWTSVLSNLPQTGAFVVAESTPLHHGDQLQRIWEEADQADSPWLKCFLPWTHVAEYAMDPPKGWRPNEVVQDYADKFRINERQAYWMQALGIPNCSNKIEKFRAEYPIDDMDCWRELGSTVFDFDKLHARLRELDVTGMTEPSGDTRVFLEPQERHKYAITVDPAGSFSKRDYFGIQGGDLSTCEQAFESMLHGDAFQIARTLVLWAKKYNDALIVVEANGVGDALLLCLVNLGYKNIYWRGRGAEKRPGWWSDQRRKVEAFGVAQELLEDGSCSINSHRLLRHMQKSLGPLAKAGRDAEGGHYDLVSAWVMFCWVYRHVANGGIRPKQTDPRELAQRAWNAVLRKIGQKEGLDDSNKYGKHVGFK